MSNPTKIIVSIVLALLFLTVQAQAVIYPFTPVYPANAGSTAAEAMALQLSLGIEEGPEAGQVEFIFYNNLAPGYVVGSPLDGIITGVFFEDGFLESLDLDPIITYSDDGDPAINFVQTSVGGSAPWGLPFGTGHSFEAVSTPGVNPGVEPTEGVGIVFNLTGGGSISDIYDALAQGFEGDIVQDESLRIGIHVQNYGENNNYSDAFILTPVPASVVIGLLGMGIAGIKLRKFA